MSGSKKCVLEELKLWLRTLAICSITSIITYFIIYFFFGSIKKYIEVINPLLTSLIVAVVTFLIFLYLFRPHSKNRPVGLAILWILGAIGFGLIITGIFFAIDNRFGFSFATIGIGCFLLSLALMSYLTYCSISQEENKRRSKSLLILDRKEIRRSIVISFTILFILLIAFYFLVAEDVVRSVNNLSQPLDVNATKLAVEGLTSVSNVITAFATIYVVIMGFYFGSRVYEKIKEIKDAEETLKIRYILDEIDVKEFKDKIGVLRGIKTMPQLEIKAIKSEKKITIEHKDGEAIDLKDAEVIIEMNKKKISIDPVAHACEKDVFKVGERMEINMDEKTTADKYIIEVFDKKENGANTGIKRKDICNCMTDADWATDGKVEVTVVFTDPTGQIIREKKGIPLK